MRSWHNVTINDLGQIITGSTPPTKKTEYYGNKYPFITPTDIEIDSRIVRTDRFLSQEGYEYNKNRLLPNNAVCVVCIASIGKICMTTVPSVTNQQINSVVVNQDKYDPYFVYYLLRTKTDVLKNIAGGVASPIVNKTTFANLKVSVPSLQTQHKIASILSTYDDLIENNTRRIKILEDMAQTLYREWFVHYRFPGHENVLMVESQLGQIPRGWEVKKFGEVSHNFDRLRKPLSGQVRSTMQGEYPYYGAAKVLDHINDYLFDGRYLLIGEDGSVVTEDGKPVLQLVTGKFWVNNHTHVVQGKSPISTNFLYLFMSNVVILGYVTGAAQPKINQQNLNRIPVILPPQKLLEKFDQMIESNFENITALKMKNATLCQTRDLLLPKLISGEIDVSELNMNTN